RAGEFGCGILGVGQRHRADEAETLRRCRAPGRERVVEHAMPGGALLARQTVAIDVRPGGDELMVDALAIEPGDALLDRIDELREHRANFEAVVELQGRRCRAVDHANAEIFAVAANARDQFGGNVVGVDVDGHDACLRDVVRASSIRRHRRGGVSGSSVGLTPSGASAAATALPTAAATATMPPSPAPLAPSGLL